MSIVQEADGVGEEFGPHAYVDVHGQLSDDGVRNRTDPHLEGGAVTDPRSHPVTDLAGQRTRGRHGGSWQRSVDENTDINVIDVNDPVAEDMGHVRIDLGNDESTSLLGRVEGGRQHLDLNTHAHGAIAWRAGVQNEDVGRESLLVEARCQA